ncbi:hypothetical protein [Natronobacterium gregoryi]|uniref:DUF8097 domain-containing protein n=2 Tax=Natronobacterium gregoryi TaxID=44930 RepID=L0AJI7_NATGS|nr:hypothetical protein [Natronobacterium gregoryi]AFZ73976.1 hypothetical protein Natgr_2832 [Natronobacterium gregoryi SP2]ELY68819.1 hypothetical protein C490_08906 [Natronobacterium gregoryi SP2]PLK18285.1 hypothetical protein CYV19_18335 [Natronobacterium gregoryi SP2]SFJ72464.1 hypothetical protein SAMN05443661_1669 [Natronobacterium gregoryi]
MVSQRTGAIVDLVVNVATFLAVVRYARSDETAQSRTWFAAGFVQGSLSRAVADRELLGPDRRLRWLGAAALVGVLEGVSPTESNRAAWSTIAGHSLGVIVYRLWYGVVGPLPGDT